MNKKTELIPIVDGGVMQQPNPFNPLIIKNGEDGRIVDYFIYDGDGEHSPDCITQPFYYMNFISILGDLKPQETVNVHLNSCGGSLQASLMIYEALMNTQAKVVMYLEGEVASGASMIMMAGDDYKVAKHSYVMIHSWSGGLAGKSSDIKRRCDFDNEWFTEAFTEIYSDFLTEEEILNCLENGREYRFKSQEVMDRLNKAKQKYIDRDRLIAYIQQETQEKVNKEITDCIGENGVLTEKGYKKLQQMDKKYQVKVEEDG